MSEYGKGFAYNLGLFLAHAERDRGRKETEIAGINISAMWFNGASDHLFEIETDPEILGEELSKEVIKFVDFVSPEGVLRATQHQMMLKRL